MIHNFHKSFVNIIYRFPQQFLNYSSENSFKTSTKNSSRNFTKIFSSNYVEISCMNISKIFPSHFARFHQVLFKQFHQKFIQLFPLEFPHEISSRTSLGISQKNPVDFLQEFLQHLPEKYFRFFYRNFPGTLLGTLQEVSIRTPQKFHLDFI